MNRLRSEMQDFIFAGSIRIYLYNDDNSKLTADIERSAFRWRRRAAAHAREKTGGWHRGGEGAKRVEREKVDYYYKHHTILIYGNHIAVQHTK